MSQCPLRVAVYARVSSDRQAKAATIDSQVADLRRRISEDGHVLEQDFCFLDDGYSGSTLLRPALELLRDMVYSGAIDRLYVHSPDRLARKYAYQVLLTDEFQSAGVEVVFFNHAVGESPEGELLLQVQGVIAEYERAKILERSRRGKRHAARQGSVSVLGTAPYGYRYITKQAGGGVARYEIVEHEAQAVRQMFEWVARDGVSINEVCRRLQQQRLSTPRGKEIWGRTTVWKMLKNTAYKGSASFGKTRIGKPRPEPRPRRGRDGLSRLPYAVYATPVEEQESIPVPAIVSQDLFESVKEQLDDNRRRRRIGAKGASYLLQGILQCASCGYSCFGMYRKSKRGKTVYRYYRCVGNEPYRFGGQRICNNKGIRTDVLEEAVWEDVCALLRDPDRVRQEYERRLDGERDTATATCKQLDALIHKVSHAIARLIDAYKDDLLSKDEFEPRIRADKLRLAKLQEERKQMTTRETEQKQLRLVIAHLEEFYQRISESLQTVDWPSKREIIRALVKRVEFDNTNVRVIYKVSQLPFVPGRGQDLGLQDRLPRAVRVFSPHAVRGKREL
jgi:site-specific DNA recombinase